MSDGFDIVQRGPGGGDWRDGRDDRDGSDIVQRGRGGFPRGFPGRFPRRFPRRRFPIRRFPIFFPPVFFPPGRCFFIDRFGRCCDRFGRCFYGGFPFAGVTDVAETWDDGMWDGTDGYDMYEDRSMPAFNETDSGWDDQY